MPAINTMRLPPIGCAHPHDRNAMAPRRDGNGAQRVSVDATWGTLQPIQVADRVHTVGELEVIEHLEAGRPVVDSRTPDLYTTATLPGARSIPHDQAIDRIDELAADTPTVFCCNGPHCGQSPWRSALSSMPATPWNSSGTTAEACLTG